MTDTHLDRCLQSLREPFFVVSISLTPMESDTFEQLSSTYRETRRYRMKITVKVETLPESTDETGPL
jgi:hypothetical protein